LLLPLDDLDLERVLVSGEGGYVTGIELVIDGGYLAQ
jgi:hypothetical protein